MSKPDYDMTDITANTPVKRKSRKDNKQEVQNVQVAHEVHEVQEVKTDEFGKTQGKKGCAVKRINMGFSRENHEYLKTEPMRRGQTITEFVNELVAAYRESDQGYRYGK